MTPGFTAINKSNWNSSVIELVIDVYGSLKFTSAFSSCSLLFIGKNVALVLNESVACLLFHDMLSAREYFLFSYITFYTAFVKSHSFVFYFHATFFKSSQWLLFCFT